MITIGLGAERIHVLPEDLGTLYPKIGDLLLAVGGNPSAPYIFKVNSRKIPMPLRMNVVDGDTIVIEIHPQPGPKGFFPKME